MTISSKFYQKLNIRNSFFKAQKDGKYGLINIQNKLFIPLKYNGLKYIGDSSIDKIGNNINQVVRKMHLTSLGLNSDMGTIEADKKNLHRILKGYQILNSQLNILNEELVASDLDRTAIINNRSIMEDIARQYLQIRTDGLGFAYPHYDTAHPHVHFLPSANQKESSKSIRISKAEFTNIKRKLEEYMIINYPEL